MKRRFDIQKDGHNLKINDASTHESTIASSSKNKLYMYVYYPIKLHKRCVHFTIFTMRDNMEIIKCIGTLKNN